MIEILFLALLGAVFGSFMGVVTYRVPQNISIFTPSSRCDSCNTLICWYQNIPIVSYLLLRGKCSNCGSMIDLQQFVCEVVLSLLLVAIYLKVGLGFEMVMLFISFSLLFSLSLIDLRYKAVPDSLNLLALFFAIFSTVQSYEIVQNLHYATVFAGGFVLLRFCVSYFKKQEAMGEADIIVAATMGAILHLKLALFAIFLSAILAIVAMAIIYKKDFALPFIPFLSLALFITYLYEDTIYKVLGAIYG